VNIAARLSFAGHPQPADQSAQVVRAFGEYQPSAAAKLLGRAALERLDFHEPQLVETETIDMSSSSWKQRAVPPIHPFNNAPTLIPLGPLFRLGRRAHLQIDVAKPQQDSGFRG
jgi:hypothetical protein